MSSKVFYPPVSFFFKVSIDGLDDSDSDFQEVTGLSQTIETLNINEGGENRFSHQVPVRTKSDKLILKRGMKINSKLQKWCRESTENFSFTPKNLFISLLDPSIENALHNPLITWHIINAYPTKWSCNPFNALNNDFAVETIELTYNYFVQSFSNTK
jgi:phage tail-like protein